MSYEQKYKTHLIAHQVFEHYDKELKSLGWLLYKISHRTPEESRHFRYCKDDLYLHLSLDIEPTRQKLNYYSLSVIWDDYIPPEEYKCKYHPDREVIVPTTQTPEEFQREAWISLIVCLTIVIGWHIFKRRKIKVFEDQQP